MEKKKTKQTNQTKKPFENYNILQLYYNASIAGQPDYGVQMKYYIYSGVQLLSENTLFSLVKQIRGSTSEVVENT